ncbi:hypothetical protein ACQZ44_12555 [Agrobacterium vitis]
MPRDNMWWLSELAVDRVGVICEECEILRLFDGKALLAEYGDRPMPSFLRTIAEEKIHCQKPWEGFSGRCRLTYYRTASQRPDDNKSDHRQALTRRDIRSWEMVVAGCRKCKNVAELPRYKLERMCDPETPLIALIPRLKCSRCDSRGESFISIVKLPR